MCVRVQEVMQLPGLSTSDVAEAADRLGLQIGLLPGLRRVSGAGLVMGRAHVATAHPSDEPGLPGLGQLLSTCPSDGIVVIGWSGATVASTFGGTAARRMADAGRPGLITDGYVRDVEELRRSGFAVWSADTTPCTGIGRLRLDAGVQEARVSGIVVHKDDVVVADDTGICVLPEVAAQAILSRAARGAEEDALVRAILDRDTGGKPS